MMKIWGWFNCAITQIAIGPHFLDETARMNWSTQKVRLLKSRITGLEQFCF
jgi:hypothetical protein